MSNGGICFFSRDWIGICIRLENLQLQFFQLDWDWIRISLRVEIYVKRGDLFFQQGLDLDSHPIRKSTTLVFFSQIGIRFGFDYVSKSMSNGRICFFSMDWIWIWIRLENLQFQFFQLDWDWIRISLHVEIYVKRADLFFPQGLDLDLHPIRKSTTLVCSARLGLDSDFTACRNLCPTGGFVFFSRDWIGICIRLENLQLQFFQLDQDWIRISLRVEIYVKRGDLFFQQGLDLDLYPIRKSTTLVFSARFGLDSDFTACRNLCQTGGFVFSVEIGFGFPSDQKIYNFSFFSQIGIRFGFHYVSKSMSNAGICFFSRDWIWICIRLENLQLQFFQLDWDWIRISLRVEIYVKRGDLFFQQGLDLDSHPIRKSTTLVFFSQIGIRFGFHYVSKSMSNGLICFFRRDWIWIPIRLENLQLQFFQLDWDQIRI